MKSRNSKKFSLKGHSLKPNAYSLLLKAKKHSFIIISLTLITLIKFALIWLIDGNDWEPDSFQHFNQLATVYSNFPNNLEIGIGVWAKPLYSYVFGLPVEVFGIKSLSFIQILNTLIFFIISFLVHLISLRIYKNKSIAYFCSILTSLSFVLFKSSITGLTEPIFALMIICGIYFSERKSFKLAGLFFGLSALARIEGLFFVAIFGAWLGINYIVQKKFFEKLKSILIVGIIAILPAIIWNFFGYLQTGSVLYIFDDGYPTDVNGIYGYGSWLSYPKKFLFEEPLISIIFGVSLILLGIKFIKTKKVDPIIGLLSLSSVLFILSQIITWRYGLVGSAGLMRYFVSILPMMIIICGFALSELIGKISKYSFRKIANLNYLVFLGIAFQILFTIALFAGIPPFESRWIIKNENLKEAGLWAKDYIQDDTYFLGADRPEVIYYSGRNLQNSDIFYSPQLSSCKKGLYIWSKDWGPSSAGVNEEYIADLECAKFIKEVENLKVYLVE